MLCPMLVFLFALPVESYSINQVDDGILNDLIVDLPGLPEQPLFNQYSGYLNGIGGNKLHYWFVESEDNPHDDPLVIWFNGGPGCSSLTGLLEENGPFRVKPDGRSLEYQPFRWNKIVNMLYIESPVGVGFSYNPEAEYYSNDTLARDNKYAAVKDFLRRYSDFAKNPLYIFGQSYGGIYVPTLSALIVDDPDINFQGFGIGNGFVSSKYISGSLPYYQFHHGMFGDREWAAMRKECCSSGEYFCDFSSCKDGKYVDEAYAFFGYNNPYAVNAACPRTPPHSSRKRSDHSALEETEEEAPLCDRAIGMGYPCVNSTATIVYLNDPAVREALHIPRDIPGIKEWWMCTRAVNYEWDWEAVDMTDNFLKVLSEEKRVLMYYGELDIICNFLGGRWFTENLNQTVVEDHRPWYYTDDNDESQVGGGVDKFRNLLYVSVKGGSHMVPKETADKAYTLFRAFIKNEDLPEMMS